ncbi:DUF1289 domain-containing protein [Rhodovulum adriaticum]|uniref:Fe-S protein YdhL (DUF1289 family) n=1 Tax=Rhodovulum adriaticum TaxID=35804 RepID=A0A4R2NTV7_RHOAD|nr:DUF1289 domain-containing protein [Rhodovulum adriaticum]MBK1635942.1 hypothetical protein [Rhodovulum adriaticum]TCP25400.1 hypothetical protein EV656_103150 [Rhodovulum adriaticum]
MTKATPIETPCTQVCRVDPETRLCIGCARSIDEIGGWLRMSPDERRRVMAELPGRQPRRARTA